MTCPCYFFGDCPYDFEKDCIEGCVILKNKEEKKKKHKKYTKKRLAKVLKKVWKKFNELEWGGDFD